jgi:hypothetical protein
MRMVICLQIPTTFWIAGRIRLSGVECTRTEGSEVRQTEIHTVEPLALHPSPFEVVIAVTKLKSYENRSSGSEQIPAELIQAGGETLRTEIRKLLNSIWKKEELPGQWMESIIVRIYEKGDKTDCSNYRGMSLLSASYKISANRLLALLWVTMKLVTLIKMCLNETYSKARIGNHLSDNLHGWHHVAYINICICVTVNTTNKQLTNHHICVNWVY